jgi:hypothetical protein
LIIIAFCRRSYDSFHCHFGNFDAAALPGCRKRPHRNIAGPAIPLETQAVEWGCRGIFHLDVDAYGVAPAARRVLAPLAEVRSARWAVAIAAVVVVWAVAMAQWIVGDLVVPWDSKNQFYAFFRFLASTIHSGSTPFWNPFHYAGHPSLADPQSLILSPPFLIWALFDPAPSLRAFDLIVFAHLLLGGIAMVFYGRRHGWSAAACVLAATVFMFGGPVAGRAEHVGIITVYALFPVALLLFEIAFDRRSLLAAAGCAMTAGLIALGRNQESLLLCALLLALAVGHIAQAERPWATLASRAGVLTMMAGLTVVILLVPMLLTLQFAAFSNRPHIRLDAALMSSLYPVNFANFFVPNVLGSLQPISAGDWGPNWITRPGLDATDSAFNYLFAGSLTALLLVWHGIAGGRAFSAGRRLLTAAAVVAALYAVGRATPLFSFLFEHVPGIDLFRRPVGATFIAILALAFLTGHLLSDYVRHGVPRAPAWVVALSIAAVAALLAWAVAFSAHSAKAGPAALEIAKAAPIYLALIALLVLARSVHARLVAACVAAAFTAGELVARNAAASFNAEPRSYYALLERPAGDDIRIVQAIERAVAQDRTRTMRPRVEVVGLGGPWQNAAMVLGLEATNGYNPMRIGPYDMLVAPGEDPWTTEHRHFPQSFPRYDCLLSRLLSLEFVVLDRPIEKMPYLKERPAADLIMAGPEAWIYKLHDPAPRVSLAGIVRLAHADSLVKAGRFPASMPNGEVWIDDRDKLRQRYPGAGAHAPGTAEIADWRPDRVEVAVDSQAAAILTLHDLWYPGWEVEVDGVSRPLLRADVLFRGVEVPAGPHRVVFSFRPLSAANLMAAFKSALGAPVR